METPVLSRIVYSFCLKFNSQFFLFLPLLTSFSCPLCVCACACVFLQALMHYAGSRNSIEHGLPLLEVYCLSINCFAAARSHLTAESDRVALVLKRLALWVLTLAHDPFYWQHLFNYFERLGSQPATWAPFNFDAQFFICIQFAWV